MKRGFKIMATKKLKDARRAKLFEVALSLQEKGVLTKVVKKQSTNNQQMEVSK